MKCGIMYVFMQNVSTWNFQGVNKFGYFDLEHGLNYLSLCIYNSNMTMR